MSYPRLFTTPGVGDFAEELDAERARQLAKFGDQRHPDGTGQYPEQIDADVARMACQSAAEGGYLDWLHILREEVAEALAESDPAKLRAELVQVAAVCAAWISDIDRRGICARCHGHGRIPNLSKPLNADFGEPEAKPCPDCQTKDHR